VVVLCVALSNEQFLPPFLELPAQHGLEILGPLFLILFLITYQFRLAFTIPFITQGI